MPPIDTTECENEPIRFPGAVLPHGALLVLKAGSSTIEAASESCADLLGLGPDRLIGRPLGDVIGATSAAEVLAARTDAARPRVLSIQGRAFTARARDNASGQVLVDIEPGEDTAALADMTYALRRGVVRLRDMSVLNAVCQAGADLFRDVTGYDRVMIYRFDRAWNGAVVGESRAPGLKPYLGLNFPATDIPKQARDLFKISGVRVIVDVQCMPSPLIGSGEPRSIDLGPSSLRSVSPIHIQYLKNMGVGATLVGSLVVDGELWGHLSCHHESGAKSFGPAARDLIQWACQDLAALIGATESRERRERERELAAHRQVLVQKLRSADLPALMRESDTADLLGVVGADGFALISGNRIEKCGHTPSTDAIERLLGLWRERTRDPRCLASNALARDFGEAFGADGIAGALFVSAPEVSEVTLAWFRRERRQTVQWGGDPERPNLVGADGHLTPRASFDLFLQEIAGTSLDWRPEELSSAKELGSLIEIELLRKAMIERKVLDLKLRASQRRFEAIYESGLVGVMTATKFGLVTDANDRLLQMLGYTREELRRGLVNWRDITPPEFHEITEQKAKEAQSLGFNSAPYEKAYLRKDGTQIPVLIAVALLDDVNFVAVVLDLTERKAAEETLRASEERFRTLFEEAPDAIAIVDFDRNRFVAVNGAGERLVGASRDEILERGPQSFFTPEQADGSLAESFLDNAKRALAGEVMTLERQVRRVSGEVRLCRATLVRLPSDVRLIRASLVDITEQDQVRRELASTAAILAAEHEASPDGILVVDLMGRILSINRRFREMFSIPTEMASAGEAGPMAALALPHVTDADAFIALVQHLRGHPDESSHDEVNLKDGRVFDRLTSPFKIADGETLGRIWFFRDITERRKSEKSLHASEERFRTLVEDAPDAILLYDFDQDRMVATNKAAERLAGVPRDEILRHGRTYFYAPEQPDGRPAAESIAEHIERALAGEEVTFERLIHRPSGEARLCRGTLVRLPSHIRLLRTSFVDITEEDRVRRELASTAAILITEHEASPDGILVFDPTGRILSANRRLAEILGVPYELPAARDYPALRAAILQRLTDAEAVARGMQYLTDHPDDYSRDELLFKDGRVIDRITAPFKTADGKTLGRIAFFRDITERRKAEDSLRASEERFRTVIEEAPDAILIVDWEQDRVVAANKAAERLFAVSRDEILERGSSGFHASDHPDELPLAESYARNGERALAGEVVTFERGFRRPSGEVRLCRATLVRLPSNIRLLRASLVDITEQRAAEAQVSDILRGTVALQEAERQRIARELHDSVNQYLAVVAMKLDVFARGLSESSPLGPGIAELKGLTASVEDEVSRIAWELRPIALDDIGLEPAIQRLIDEWARRSNLRIDLDLALKGRRLPPEVEVNLYRILQEGLTNIVKHAGAGRIGVIATASPDGVVMIIEDDGKGFDPETVNRGSSPHFGLLGMRERLALIGGSLEIETRPGAGTTLIIRAPLKGPVRPT